ncbi:MAG: hypothetical protein LQ349_005088 [Xanthoria aureola]|nr:MAG: hypothetical protein LQ349_005088 [Xanthoria aureola]
MGKHETEITMPSLMSQGDSSPDPLALSQDASSPVKAKTRPTPPRTALSTMAGNVQAHDIKITTPALHSSRPTSPVRSGGANENEQSPWQIRITVQAEQNNRSERSSKPQSSPPKHFTERTFTTTVPLKADDMSSPVRRNARGAPTKARNSSGKRGSTSKNSANRGLKAQGDPSPDVLAGTSSASPKRGRGRPRKSVDTTGLSPSPPQSRKKKTNKPQALPNLEEKQRSPCKTSGSQANRLDRTKRGTRDFEDQYEDFDSIIESEGFSMVSVSSLPSAQGSSGVAPGSELRLRRSPRSLSKRHVTPSDSHHSPPLPPPAPPPKVVAVQSPTRELNKATSGTPRLARVVRAGIALQGVLSPARQRQTPATLAPWLNHSSPMSSISSPKERLDQLFNGFGPGTCRELRAGLRLGEELAKRQNPEISRSDQQANEDVFAPNLEVGYPELPATEKYSLKIPYGAMKKSPPFCNPQLPSPARSEASVDDDRMSWKFDTLQSNAVQANLADIPATIAQDIEEGPSSVNQTMLEREAGYQREREAISKQIREANSSQVIVIESDDEDEGSAEATTYEDDGDIWQEEAQISGSRPSTSEIPPVFVQNKPRKPRRSQIPSPWMRKTQDIQTTSPAPNDSNLFWQPNHTESLRQNPEIPMQQSAKPSRSRVSAVDTDGASDDIEDKSIAKDSKSKLEAALPSPTSEQVARVEETPPQHQRQTIPNKSFDSSDLENSTYDAEDSDNSFTDDEGIESTLLSHHFMQDDITSPLDEGTRVDLLDVHTPSSSRTGISEEIPEPRTPSCLARTPKASSSKKVRFTAETKTSDSLTELSAPPLPPAPSSWFTRVTSLLPTWTNNLSAPTVVAAAIPLPTKPVKTIKLPEVDVGPLPSYMPWQPSHWWALIHITRQISATPSAYPYDAQSLSASWLGTVVSVNQWAKKITKTDCTVVERFMRTLSKRGTFRGVEEALFKGGNKKQWGKGPGEWIDRRTVLSAVVAQWAVDVQDGVAELAWGDRAGLKAGGGGRWTERDKSVDGCGVVYVL